MIKKIKKFFEKFRRKKGAVGTAIIINKKTSPLDVDLVDDNLNTKDKKKLRQFSKIIIVVLLSMAGVWITWSYVLATIALMRMYDSQPLEELSKTVVTGLVGTSLGYFCKAYLETYSEKKNEIELMKINTDEPEESVKNDDPVG